MSYRVALLIVAASMFGFAGAARAESVTVTKAVQDACAWEYDKFCNQYGLGHLSVPRRWWNGLPGSPGGVMPSMRATAWLLLRKATTPTPPEVASSDLPATGR